MERIISDKEGDSDRHASSKNSLSLKTIMNVAQLLQYRTDDQLHECATRARGTQS